jgi:hypothetical protein
MKAIAPSIVSELDKIYPDKVVFTVGEAQKLFNLSPPTMERNLAAGRINFIRTAVRKRGITRAEVLRILAGGLEASNDFQ